MTLCSCLAQSGARPYIPNRTKRNRLQEQGFEYDRRSRGTLRCRAGKFAIGSTPHKNGGLISYFPEKDCSECPFRSACLTGSQERKTIYIKPEVFRKPTRGLKRAMRRKTIERVFGEAKAWHNIARARYRGRARVAIQVLLLLFASRQENGKKVSFQIGWRKT